METNSTQTDQNLTTSREYCEQSVMLCSAQYDRDRIAAETARSDLKKAEVELKKKQDAAADAEKKFSASRAALVEAARKLSVAA